MEIKKKSGWVAVRIVQLRFWALLVLGVAGLSPELVMAQYCPPTIIVKTWHACDDVKLESCSIHHTHQYVPSGSCPTPPTFIPPPPSLPPPSGSILVAVEEKKVFCDTASIEIAADVRSCQNETALKRDMQIESCRDHGTLNWSVSYKGARMETTVKQIFEYSSLIQCKGMVRSFAGFTTAECDNKGNRARGRAVAVCGPIQW